MILKQEQFERELNYYTSVYLIEKILEKELITKKDYIKICSLLCQQFKPILDGITLSNFDYKKKWGM